MNNKSQTNNLNEYAIKVADYIEMEYGGFDSDVVMTDDERFTVRNIMMGCYDANDSINNTANMIMEYLKKNRVWKENNQ